MPILAQCGCKAQRYSGEVKRCRMRPAKMLCQRATLIQAGLIRRPGVSLQIMDLRGKCTGPAAALPHSVKNGCLLEEEKCRGDVTCSPDKEVIPGTSHRGVLVLLLLQASVGWDAGTGSARDSCSQQECCPAVHAPAQLHQSQTTWLVWSPGNGLGWTKTKVAPKSLPWPNAHGLFLTTRTD